MGTRSGTAPRVRGLTAAELVSLVGSSGLAVMVHDAYGRVVEANRACANLLGRELVDVLDGDAFELIAPDERGRARDLLADLVDRAESDGVASVSAECTLLAADGSPVPVLTHLSAASGSAGPMVMACLVDLRPSLARLARVTDAAIRDPLTGLLNRAGLMAHLEARAGSGRPACIALLDLDRLKNVNDTYGHAAGDLLLKRIAAVLTELAVPDGIVSRLAGDEFVVLAETADEPALGRYLATHLAPVRVEVAPGVVLAPTASIGTAPVAGWLSPEQSLGRADESMYAAKRARESRG
jgi:diguanylate cyclase (GGDEF)-like protein/PAS domain S-box-containing protein